jgi:hypothetical protein
MASQTPTMPEARRRFDSQNYRIDKLDIEYVMHSSLAFIWELLEQALLLTVSWMGTNLIAVIVVVVVVPVVQTILRLRHRGLGPSIRGCGFSFHTSTNPSRR